MRLGWITLAYLTAVAAPAAADTFTLDRQHTEVRFSWDHLGLSRQSGRFTDVSGTLQFDPERPDQSTVDVTIPMVGLMTGVPALDQQLLKTKDYFDVAGHPVITFKSGSVRQTGDKTAELIGDLTMNGITKPVTLAVVWNFMGEHPLSAVNPTFAGKTVAGFSARTHLLRSDWGMTRIIPLISDEIRISIETELIKTP